ncbi:MAG: formate/nitrite transporter family protein [Bacteroidetes bacterium]|nr:formate/nitrite transporter family protein [Bacteroidota bacterium]MBK9423032.1 formate/nitrite transporter family protein [Bacteroidota bacterium]MBL0072286.1 formate/nitrite transporter family protein [Bacteroidota bacterium]
MKELFGFNSFSPEEIADRVESVGVAKSRLPFLSLVMLGVLAGVFIGFGAMLFTLVTSDSTLSFAISRILGGISFSLGLILVVVAGAELFTGNNLLAMAWADGKIGIIEVLRNWVIVCFSNFAGALLLALLVVQSGHTGMNDGEVGKQYLEIAAAKCAIPFHTAFFSGVLCNMLVCLAVWMAMAGRSVMDKVIAIIFPITAFVAAGFEHSVANMYFLVMGIFLNSDPAQFDISWGGFMDNMIPVIMGNLIGGSVFVALTYFLIYKTGGNKMKTK